MGRQGTTSLWSTLLETHLYECYNFKYGQTHYLESGLENAEAPQG